MLSRISFPCLVFSPFFFAQPQDALLVFFSAEGKGLICRLFPLAEPPRRFFSLTPFPPPFACCNLSISLHGQSHACFHCDAAFFSINHPTFPFSLKSFLRAVLILLLQSRCVFELISPGRKQTGRAFETGYPRFFCISHRFSSSPFLHLVPFSPSISEFATGGS